MVCVVGQIPESARNIGILAGAFNPPTVAHLALLKAASTVVDSVVCAIPREYPHKEFSGATIAERIAMLGTLSTSVVISDRGLFIDMAREFRRDLHPSAALHFICGRDAAERIVTWDYGLTAPAIAEQLGEYQLLVARRAGEFRPPPDLEPGVTTLHVEEEWDAVSSTKVRDWILSGDPRWRDLIPAEIADQVARIYGIPSRSPRGSQASC